MEINLCFNCMKEKKEPGSCPHCGFDPEAYEAEPHHLPLGTILAGKYLVGRVLGEGGFGITYVGWDLNLELKVAIKEYYPNGFVTRNSTFNRTLTVLTGSRGEFFQKGLDKFVDEARRLGKFWQLPGIVSVKDYFQENKTGYIVMEFAEGHTLKEILKKSSQGRLPPERVFAMMRPVMKSLNKVHEAGLIHRDISPDNLMVARDGRVKLIDFGAARDFLAEGEKSLSVMLKPGYAPEEQYRSRGKQGPWTDVYGLCATMYRAITGQVPEESLDRVAEDTLRSPSQLGIPIAPWQENALMQGLAVFQRYRLQSMEELEAALYPPPPPPKYFGDGAPGQERVSGTENLGRTTSAEGIPRDEEPRTEGFGPEGSGMEGSEMEGPGPEGSEMGSFGPESSGTGSSRTGSFGPENSGMGSSGMEAFHGEDKDAPAGKGPAASRRGKKRALVIGAGAVLVLAAGGFLIFSLFGDKTVEWADSNMEQMICQGLDLPREEIKESDLEAVRVLRICGDQVQLYEDTGEEAQEPLTNVSGVSLGKSRQITSLEDLKYFPNLEILQIRDAYAGEGTAFQDEADGGQGLEALGQLKNLRVLDLSANDLEDLEGISEITQLEELILSSNSISDISLLTK